MSIGKLHLLIALGVTVLVYYFWGQDIIWIAIHYLDRLKLPHDSDGSLSLRECGGSSFVELCTGLNLALVSVREFRHRLRFVEDWFKSFSDSMTLNIVDQTQKARASKWYDKITEGWKKVNSVIWYFSFTTGIVMLLTGAWMLYCNSYCYQSWFLLTPWLFYLCWMFLCWILLQGLSLIVAKVCNTLSDQEPKKEIQDFGEQSKE
jgi:hypothetical protein